MSIGSKVVCGISLSAAALVVAVAAAPRAGGSSEGPAQVQPASASQIARGRYLVNVIGCNDCHTPHDDQGQPMPGRFLTGHPVGATLPQWDPSMLEKGVAIGIAPTFTAFAGPFGVSIAPNLTPDPDTGIAKMTADDLVESWRTGKHWNLDRPVLPPMPVQVYKNMTEQDIRAIHAYLMSLPPTPATPLAPPAPATR